jgi:N-methylhydantoinase B
MRDPSTLMSIIERTQSPAWGLHGGGPGRANGGRLRFPDGTVQELTKVTGLELPAGTLIEILSGGGGGFGPPGERDPEAVHNDIREGYITEAAAQRDYPHAFPTAPVPKRQAKQAV